MKIGRFLALEPSPTVPTTPINDVKTSKRKS